MKPSHVLWTIAAGVAGFGAAWAHGGATGIVKERMDAMTEISRNVKLVGQMLKGNAAYDGVEIARAGQAIATHAGDAMIKLFPEGSLKAPSEASPSIWNEWTQFSGYADSLQTSAQSLKGLAEQGADQKAVAAAFGKMAGTCKACHEAFRIKK
ncbi:cytochrome c556 [Labrenzia sp. EL_208]|nr:cytochrome c556 [Labrenzia sp. EL_132]MBG6231092.1 cytochrome c556 [Labrenzia sp. EL_208]